jgi:predicted porin
MWGVFDTLEYGSALLRIGYQKRIASSLNLLTGVQGAWVPNSDLSIGASFDPGNWFVMSEWIQRKSTTKLSAMYVSAGVRVDKFTPYITYSNNGRGSFLPGFPPPTAASIVSANRSQSTASMGVRWDFMKHADFKLQYDQVKLSDNSNGYVANLPVNTVLFGSSFHVISAVVDFVF